MQTESRDLKVAGLKVTAPRVKILQILESSKIRHLSAEDIYRKLLTDNAAIGLATVYRVLTQFEEAGLVIRHHFAEGSSVFELAGTSHHDHLLCIKCGRVEEFSEAEIEKLQQQIADKLGFELIDHNLNMYGYCSKCRT